MVLCVFALRYAHSGIDAPWYYWLLPYLLTAVYLIFAIWFNDGSKYDCQNYGNIRRGGSSSKLNN